MNLAELFEPPLNHCLDFFLLRVYPNYMDREAVFFSDPEPSGLMPSYEMTKRAPAMFMRLREALLPFAITLGAALFLVTLSACKSAPPQQQAVATPEQNDKNPDEASKTIPSDLFKDLPIYPGATVEHVHKPKGAMREIVLSTNGQLSQLVDFYREGLKANNFHVTSSLIMPARKTWSCDFHKQGRPATILLYPDEHDKSKMVIDLIYEMPPKNEASMEEAEETFDVNGPGEVAQQAPNTDTKAKRN